MNKLYNKILKEASQVMDFDSWDESVNQKFKKDIQTAVSPRLNYIEYISEEVLDIPKKDAEKVLKQLEKYVKKEKTWYKQFFEIPCKKAGYKTPDNFITDVYAAFLFTAALFVEIERSAVWKGAHVSELFSVTARAIGCWVVPGCETNPYDYSWFEEPMWKNENPSDIGIGGYISILMGDHGYELRGIKTMPEIRDVLYPMVQFCEDYNIDNGNKVWELIQGLWEIE